MGIGIPQGYLAKVYKVNGKVVASGTKIGLAFWFIFIQVSLLVFACGQLLGDVLLSVLFMKESSESGVLSNFISIKSH